MAITVIIKQQDVVRSGAERFKRSSIEDLIPEMRTFI
jgi:hypothetical protein